MNILGIRPWDDGDRSVRNVGIAGVAALVLGGLFLVYSIQRVKPAENEAVGASPSNALAAAPAPTANPAGQRAAPATAEPAVTATSGPPGTDQARNAARCAALLWAFACCAVGAFLGFIFGIPRSLSSDTARTTVPGPARTPDAAKAKSAASKAAEDTAVAERDRARQQAEQAGADLAHAADTLVQLRAAAGQGGAADPAVHAASQAHAKLAETKKKFDGIVLEKTQAAESAAAQAKKDAEAANAATTQAAAASSQPANARGPSTAVNTNLEQISDWLTKIIVGVSLVNSEKIGLTMLNASREMANSFGGATMHSLALAMLAYFSVIGLLGGYLLTRLYLQRAFEAIGLSETAGPHPA